MVAAVAWRVAGPLIPPVRYSLFAICYGAAKKVRQVGLAPMSSLAPRQLAPAPDAIAPDGSEVRLLASLPRGSMAHFTLAPGAVTRAVAHRSVEEVCSFVGGRGRMWRRCDGEEVTVDVFPGVSIAIRS